MDQSNLSTDIMDLQDLKSLRFYLSVLLNKYAFIEASSLCNVFGSQMTGQMLYSGGLEVTLKGQ